MSPRWRRRADSANTRSSASATNEASAGQLDARLLRVAPKERRRRADLLNRLCPGAFAELGHPGGTGRSVTAVKAHFHQLVRIQCLLELRDDRVGEPALADTHDGFSAMGLRTKIGDLRAGEHDASPDAAEAGASLARKHEAALTDIKRELAAILLVGLLGAPAVIYWLDGAREMVVLVGYSVGGALWVYARVHGVLLSAGHARRGPEGRHRGP